MSILMVYQAGAIGSSRRIFSDLAEVARAEIQVIVPERIRVDPVYDKGGWIVQDQAEERDGYRLLPVPLVDPQDVRRGFVTRELRRAIRGAEPSLIHVLDEPTSSFLFQAVWQTLGVLRRPRVLFFGFENVPRRRWLH